MGIRPIAIVAGCLAFAGSAGAQPSAPVASGSPPSASAAFPGVSGPAPIRAAAAREAARVSPAITARAPKGPMPAGLKWTGIGLLIGSSAPATIAAFSDCLRSDRTCRNERRGAYVASGAIAATGAVILAVANARRAPSPPEIERAPTAERK